MNLSKLLAIHAVVTLAAGIVLIFAPGLIPLTVGIDLDPKAYLLSYLLGAAEVSVAFLSFFAKRLNDPTALRVISGVLMIFHGSAAAVEIYAFGEGIAGAGVLVNVVVRILVIVLFAYYGLYKISIHSRG